MSEVVIDDSFWQTKRPSGAIARSLFEKEAFHCPSPSGMDGRAHVVTG